MSYWATPADERPSLAECEAESYYDGPAEIATGGIRCGSCKRRHATVDDVRWCYDLAAEYAAQSAGELAAEAAATRYFEEGPESFQAARAAEEDAERLRCPNWPL